MPTPSVSILIPAHNESGPIEKTVRAARAQKYPDFEVIVIDNASTDDTAARAQEAGARVIREARKGILFAKEAGRKAARGEIIAGLDADCLPPDDWLQRGVSRFTDDTIVAVTGGYEYDDISSFMSGFIKLGFKYWQPYLNAIMQWRRRGAYMIGGNCFVRASALEKIGGYDTSIQFLGEDTDTATRLSKIGKVIFARDLFVRSSGRRFLEHGYLKSYFTYIKSDAEVFRRHRNQRGGQLR
ncbi:MAG: glycosyltransferase family 2 protein [Candidatus Kaiserbacteria bacterium]|nr:MAG: glycosyltransferase family 2 protein [Candidatus Kaiserbacteria bacterium]